MGGYAALGQLAAVLALADAGVAPMPGGETASPKGPFACLEAASEADLHVGLAVGDIGYTQTDIVVSVRKGRAVLRFGADNSSRTPRRLAKQTLTAAELRNLLQGLTAATTRLEEPLHCWSSATQTVEVTWNCGGRAQKSPGPSGRLLFVSPWCEPRAAAAGAARPQGYARALGIAEWATALLKSLARVEHAR